MRAALAVSFLLAACAGAAPPQPASTPAPVATTAVSDPTPSATSEQSPGALTLWLAPRFAPNPETRAGEILQQHLHAFEAAYPGSHVSIRIKAVHGAGGMVESLAAAAGAAPAALPDLVTLDRTALISSSDLLLDLEGPFPQAARGELYEFGRVPQGLLVGIPFAADVDVFAYKTAVFDSPPLTWSSLFTDQGSFLIAAADAESLFLVAQYLAMDGLLGLDTDLDAGVLSEALEFLSAAADSGALSQAATDLNSASETWFALRQGQEGAAQAPFAEFVASYNPTVYAAGPFPTSDGSGVVLASPWFWAIPAGVEGELEMQLVEWLSDPAFLADWSHALGSLPVQPEVLALWPDSPETAISSRLVAVALAKPESGVLQAYGPRFAAALQAVLNGDLTPAEAAALAAGQP